MVFSPYKFYLLCRYFLMCLHLSYLRVDVIFQTISNAACNFVPSRSVFWLLIVVLLCCVLLRLCSIHCTSMDDCSFKCSSVSLCHVFSGCFLPVFFEWTHAVQALQPFFVCTAFYGVAVCVVFHLILTKTVAFGAIPACKPLLQHSTSTMFRYATANFGPYLSVCKWSQPIQLHRPQIQQSGTMQVALCKLHCEATRECCAASLSFACHDCR